MTKIFVSPIPFGEFDQTPIKLLEKSGYEVSYNPYQRKLSGEELAQMAKDADGVIAATEDLTPLLNTAKNLKVISRVGIGLDSVPLEECKGKGITVAYTPDAVTHAAVEITVGAILSSTRHITLADRLIRNNQWKRITGKRIGESIIGIVGFGRIGSRVGEILSAFSPKKILVNDLKNKQVEIDALKEKFNIEIQQVEKEELYRNSDIITLHVPLYKKTKAMINKNIFSLLKPNCFLVNYARGGIIDEEELYKHLKTGAIQGAAVDVFEKEPYTGPLRELDNVVLTAHMGSCSFDCRLKMETEATEDILRYFRGETLKTPVPEEECQYQK